LLELITVSPDDTVWDAAEIMRRKGIHKLPVQEGKEIVGIVTTTDFVEICSYGSDSQMRNVCDQILLRLNPPTNVEARLDWLISIIGSGRVGSAIAFLAAATSLDDIHLVNRHKDKALGQAMDISNAIPENSPISVIGTDFSEIKNSEVVVISASTGTYVKSRTEMLPEQATMIRDIAKKIKKFAPDSKIILVSNPVDVLNYIFQKETGFSREHVIGVSSSLDSSRFRYLLAKENTKLKTTWVRK